jgi:CBS domain-containing protein/sporulation protein YlmC with PRC-barrel domain
VAFLSDLLGRRVADIDGAPVGRLEDVIATRFSGSLHPPVAAIVVRRPSGKVNIPFGDVAVLTAPVIPLTKRMDEVVPFTPGENSVFLVRDVLDKQIIDINGKRVVRVNDLQFTYAMGKYRLVAVDATPVGLARRVGLERPLNRVFRAMGGRGQSGSIPWDQVDPTAIGPAGVPLKVARNDLAKMHAADLADIVEQLDSEAQDYVFSTLDPEVAADVIEEIQPELQASTLESIEPERAADILEAMDPDEAADVLGDLSAARAADLLSRMDQEEAEDVRELLAYPEDSPGGIMTTDYIAIPADLTAGETLERMRKLAPDARTSYYLYVTEADETLIGVISLRDLVVAPLDTKVRDFMTTPVIQVQATDSLEDVAGVIAKYNLLAVPVTDAYGHMLGIVTVDDALEAVIPGAWKRRMPRVFG